MTSLSLVAGVDQGLVAMTRMVLPQMVERDRGKSGHVALSGREGGPVWRYRLIFSPCTA